MLPPIAIVKGEGALLFDENNNCYIDAISSWWVNIHGHAHPYIAGKIHEQAKKLEHVIFTGFTHEPAVQLAERLLKILPGNFSKIFYSDNGSTAIEVAIKMAIQFWRNESTNAKHPTAGRTKILAFRNSYHGDTFGAMSVSERSLFTISFQDYLFEVVFMDTPTPENIYELKKKINSLSSEIACFIYEPLLQAAGGMLIYDGQLLDELLTELKSNNIICIADEVMTGFFRTGKFFACDHLGVKPDIICLSKGLTGGSMALGVTAATQKIFEAFLSDDRKKTFFHGHSFTANPIACSAALASLDLLENENCAAQVQNIITRNGDFIGRLQNKRLNQKTKNHRQLGTIIAFEIISEKDGYLNHIGAAVTELALQNGIYLRPLGNTVYIMPPYCIMTEDLQKVYGFLNGL